MPDNRPPLSLSTMSVVLGIAMLAIGSWISGNINFTFNYTYIFFFLIFIIFPIYSLIDTFFLIPARVRLGKSWVAREAELTFDCEKTAAYEKCSNALSAIDADIRKIQKPNVIIALINGRKIVISFRGLRGGKSAAHILCDSPWVSVKIGAGANQKNLSRFIRTIS